MAHVDIFIAISLSLSLSLFLSRAFPARAVDEHTDESIPWAHSDNARCRRGNDLGRIPGNQPTPSFEYVSISS